MKFLTTTGTVLVLLSLARGSVEADNEETRNLLRTRTHKGNNLFANTVSYSSEKNTIGRRLNPWQVQLSRNSRAALTIGRMEENR